MSNGGTTVTTCPSPSLSKSAVKIASSLSLISAGTERMLVDFGKSSLIDKARQQPDKVKMVFEKVKTDGVATTFEAVQSKLAHPIPLGYCNVGVLVEKGKNVVDFKVGDRVVSNGSHADVVCVSKNLCAKIPDNVDNESAAFTVLASIGLQGIRLASPTLGENVVVIGVGLIGLLTVQMLKAQGCSVLVVDFDQAKLDLAKEYGAETCNLANGEDPIQAGMVFSRGKGVDAVIITASTKSNDPVTQAARMSRKRGRIILVGVTGLNINRADFYEKELIFQVSCSYGPGRYDTNYEDLGHDYPYAFVRWTEQRNFEAILEMMANGQLNLKSLISHRFKFEVAHEAYELLTRDKSALGILLQYESSVEKRLQKTIKLKDNVNFHPSKPVMSFIGAGNYASRVLIPAFKEVGVQFNSIVTSGGVNSVIHGEKAGFAEASTDIERMFADKETNTVAVVTQHNTHAMFVTEALKAGKHVFVEKPLAINLEELSKVTSTYHEMHDKGHKLHLMVGFNRRFSPQIQKMKTLLDSIKEPKSFILTMNAGAIPEDHWTQDNNIGGGRIIGEACHYIDLMSFLAGSKVISIQARRMGDTAGVAITEDKAAFILGFSDGSFGTINYFANGASNFPKERIEAFAGGKVLQLDNFIKLKGYGWSNFKKMNLWKQDKGQFSCAKAFVTAVEKGAQTPIAIEDIFEVTRLAIEAADQLRNQ